MKLEFLPKAYEAYCSIKQSDSTKYEKVKLMLKDIIAHPDSGIGEPTKLEGAYKGIWRRSISSSESIYYIFNADTITIISLITASIQTSNRTGELTLQEFSKEDYDSVMALMSANRGKDSEPKVGIFWYNPARNELFGIVSHRISDYSKVNASEGRITCSEMHEDVWKREFRRQKYHGDGNGPYIGAYQDKPRGRVFYHVDSDTYEVAVGKWMEQYPQAYDLILEEFNLPKEKTSAKYAIHWDIGMSWR